MAEKNAVTYPETMTPAIRDVLGHICFQCITIAGALRELGHDIPRRAEDEQAHAIHFMLPFAIQYGDDWRKHAAARLEEMRLARNQLARDCDVNSPTPTQAEG